MVKMEDKRKTKGQLVNELTAMRERVAELEELENDHKLAEEALRQSQEHYRSLFNGISEGFALHEIMCDEKGGPCDYRFLEINPAFEKLTGLRREDVVGKTMSQLLPNDDPKWVKIYGEVALTGHSVQFDNYSPVLKRHYEVFAYCPAPRQFAVLFLDITEFKRREEETQRLLNTVREERDRLSALINSINDEVWFADTEKRFTLANPPALREFGFDSTDGIDVENFAKSLKVYRSDGSLRPIEETPPLRALQGEVVRNQEEIVRIPTSGELRNRQVSASPVKDATGKIIGSVSVVRDITENKRMEEEILRSCDELEMRIQERTAELRSASLYARSLIEASLNPLVTISRDGKIMDVNRATELVTGLSRDTLIGSDFSNYFTDPAKAREGYKQVFSEGSVRDYPLAIRHTSGEIRDVLYNAVVFRNEAGEVQGVFAAAVDITGRKRAEDALRQSESRLRLLSSQLLTAQEKERRLLALEIHDSIGASLAAVKFKVEDVIGKIGDSDFQMTETLKSIFPILQGAIDEARRIQMSLRPSILDDIGLLATINWFCRQYESTYSHIRIIRELNVEESEVPDSLKTVIFRVLQEAMNNIAKHSKADRVNLSLQNKDRAIELGIQDNGHGFNIGEALSRIGTTHGLGLDSMRERIEFSGGFFSIEADKVTGTVITATWPIE
jgi:PAS domain S-box-containing protein